MDRNFFSPKGYNYSYLNFSRALLIPFKNILMEDKRYVITGNRLAKVLLPKVIEEVANYTKCLKEKLKLILLMNEYSIENIDLIEIL